MTQLSGQIELKYCSCNFEQKSFMNCLSNCSIWGTEPFKDQGSYSSNSEEGKTTVWKYESKPKQKQQMQDKGFDGRKTTFPSRSTGSIPSPCSQSVLSAIPGEFIFDKTSFVFLFRFSHCFKEDWVRFEIWLGMQPVAFLIGNPYNFYVSMI